MAVAALVEARAPPPDRPTVGSDHIYVLAYICFHENFENNRFWGSIYMFFHYKGKVVFSEGKRAAGENFKGFLMHCVRK